MNNKSWGNPFNANYSAKISEGVNKAIHSDVFFKAELTEFGLMNILLRELTGTYSFNEETEDWLLDKENVFWWNLMFYGRVGILKIHDKFLVVNINNLEYKYQEVVEVACSPARIQFEQQSANVSPNQKKSYIVKNMDDIVIINNDVTSEFFQLKFGWFIKNVMELHTMYWESTKMKLKKIAVWYNTKNKQVITDLDQSLKDNSPMIRFTNPKISNDISKSAASAIETNFQMEKLDFPNDGYIGLEDVVKYWKFGKDILGLNENVNDKQERVISTEVEEERTNTELMEVSSMRNFRKFTRDMLKKFNVNVNVIKTTDTMKAPENSEQAFTQRGNDEKI